MSETYAQAIKAAKERYKEAMEEAAAYALVIAEQHGKPLQTVCRDIAGDDFRSLVERARRLEKTAGQSADERAIAMKKANAIKARSHAKSVLKDPDQREQLLKSLTLQEKAALADALREEFDAEVTKTTPATHTLSEQWEAWLVAVNNVLTKGARLADQSEGNPIEGYAGAGFMVYQRLIERKLDAEIRELFNSQVG